MQRTWSRWKFSISTASVEMLLETGLKNKQEGFKTGVRADCSFFEQRIKNKINRKLKHRGLSLRR